MIKLWHDDVRPAPDGWVWARTNDDAKVILLAGGVTDISMDHDLGTDDAGPDPDNTGLDLVDWMCANDLVPKNVTIHSWNPQGALRMANHFNDYGFNCMISPFRGKR